MGILSLFQRKQKNTQVVIKSNTSLERAADSILSQRGKQIVDGLNNPQQVPELRWINYMVEQKGWLKCQT